MQGTIVNFRRGRHVQRNNELIMIVDGIDKKEKARELLGKKVVWKTPGNKELIGEVKRFHGNSGAVRVKFKFGLPGQIIGQKVEVR